jgi:catechol 2,3-dioxygenase-like lactoylglutathione lyase family enzyme
MPEFMPPRRQLNAVALIVADYDDAIRYYCDILEFDLIEDTILSAEKRWVLVAPKGSKETRLLLARANSAEQCAAIGNQSGGRVFLFLETDDFARDYSTMLARGVRFMETPRQESYGQVVVFEDLYGNRWDLIERESKAP